jgi:hypothetical protein
MIGLMVPSVHAEQVPSWVKSTAGWWATDQIEESEFILAIEYLIQNKIIQISEKDFSKFADVTTIAECNHSDYCESHGFKTKWTLPKNANSVKMMISGEIPWNSGIIEPLIVEVISPTGKSEIITEGFSTYGKSTAKFNGNFKLYSESETGKYNIKVTYGDKTYDFPSFYVYGSENFVPSWIKNNAKWWSEGNISDQNFLDGIEFLIENGIIKRSEEAKSITVGAFDDITDSLPINKFENLWDGYFIEKNSKNRQIMTFMIDDLYALSGTYTQDSFDYVDEKEYLTYFETYEEEIILNYPKIKCYYTAEKTPPTDMGTTVVNYVSVYACYMSNIQTNTLMTLSNEVNASYYFELQKQVTYATLDNILEKIGIYENLANLNKLEKLSQSIVPESNPNITSTTEGFSGLSCRQDGDTVTMSGKYTNGPIPHGSIWFTMGLEDSIGTILTTGSGLISDIGAYQTKMFSVYTHWEYGFENCIIEVAYTTDP